MSGSSDIVVQECPNCGAPVDVGAGATRCTYCGTLLARTQPRPVDERDAMPAPRRITRPTEGPAALPPLQRRIISTMGSLMIVIVVFFTVAGVSYLVTERGGLGRANSSLPPYVSSEAEPDLASSVTPDLALVAIALPSEQIAVTYLDGATGRPRWTGQPLSKEGGRQTAIKIGDHFVYVVDGASLLALDRIKGSVAWQTSLANALPAGCEQNCFQRMGPHLLTMARDGTLQSFDAETGRPLWSRRLTGGSASRIVQAGAHLLVPDVVDEQSTGVGWLVLDPATGTVLRKLITQCSSGAWPSRDDPILVAPDAATLDVFYGWTRRCAQRLDFRTGQLVQETTFDMSDHWPVGMPGTSLIMDRDTVYMADQISGKGTILAFATADQQLRTLIEEPQVKFETLAAQPGLVVVHAQPTYDSERNEIWGLDSESGRRLWQDVLLAKGFPQQWAVHLTPHGLSLVQCITDEKQCLVETLDPQTGVSRGQLKLQLPSQQGLSKATWTQDAAFLTISGRLYAVDLVSNKLRYVWPG
jgi:outer membrane protein assembly factor BamB